uniref:Pco147721a n=1 Tax=Arundo donax TaxID=35708 RepID=A0A0A9HR67_ARUDO
MPRGLWGGGERRGARGGLRHGRRGGADVPGTVRPLLGLRVGVQQHTAPFVVGPGMRRDGTTWFRDAQGAPLHDMVAVSSFSEHTVVDMTQVVKLDPSVPPKVACLLSCGGGTGAAWKVAKVQPGSSMAIFGLGSVGLAVAQGAKMCGASKTIGVDLNPDKEEVGKTFGVTDFVNPPQLGKNSVSEVIGEMTGGGADYSFECIGVSSVMTDA